MTEALKIAGFNKICRICLNQVENMLPVRSFNIFQMLEACTSMHEMSNDKLPQQICKDCYDLLGTLFKFKQRWKMSIEILNKILLEEESIEIKPDVDNKETSIESFDMIKTKGRTVNSEPILLDSKSNFKNEPKLESVFVYCKEDNMYPSENSREDDAECSNNSTSLLESDEKEEIAVQNLKSQANFDSDEGSQRRKSLSELLAKKYNITDLTCNICQKTLSTHSTLLRHMKTHDVNRVFKYHCPVCNKGFFETGNLNKHLNRHKGNAKYKCDKCNKYFYELSALAAHARQKHEAESKKCSYCSQEFYHQLQLTQHESTHEEKEFKCEYCGKIFNKMFKLKCHQVKHSNERPYGCSLCPKTFKFKFTLTKHKILCHSETPPRVMCNICGKLVTALRPHLETHNKDVIYKCPECPRQYTNRNILGDHVRNKHRNGDKVKPFKHFCSVCEKGFHTPRALKFHTAVHTGERPFHCHLCEKKYISRSSLDEHVRSAHKDLRPHVCAICKKAFHTKMILKNHMRTHTGERPFPCSICGKAFGFKSVLKTHMKIHS